MDQATWLTFLEQVDDPVHGEWPEDFERQASEYRLERLVASIEQEFGPIVFTDRAIQDASFHAEITFSRNLWQAEGDAMFIRTSNFGRLATISCHSAEVPSCFIDRLTPLLAAEDYIVVPDEILFLPYTGHFPLRDEHLTWWRRFFDWL